MPKSGQNAVKVAHIAAAPGERAEGHVEIGERQDSQPVRIPVSVVNGAEDGPVAYIQAASDGNELNGVAVMHSILKSLDPKKLRGAVIAVPLVNFHAFHAGQAPSPADGKKMNRCFPGNKTGTSSERIAHFLFHEAVLQSDFCIDLHQGGTGPMIDECRVRVNKSDRAGRESFEMGRVFGIGYIFHKKGPDGQLARCAPAEGIPTIDPELGGTRGWAESSICKGVQGVKNVLQHYGMIDGAPKIPKNQIVSREHRTVYSNRGGFLAILKPLGTMLKKGEKFAEIRDPFGNVLEEIAAPAECVFWTHPPYPMVASGQKVATVGVKLSRV